VTFCETFDTKNPGIPSRTGDLNPNVWGVSRAVGTIVWAPTQVDVCGGTLTPASAHDLVICNGQLREAVNDNHNVTDLAMYPKQPFDFAGRTGTVAFDVSNDTQGGHAAWPEFWITDAPVPTPFMHFNSWLSLPQHGLGVRFAMNAEIGQYGYCPNGNNINQRRFTVDSAVVIRNYDYEEYTDGGPGYSFPGPANLKLTILDCVIMSPGPDGPLNHIEVRVNQNQIDVWASDAGSTALRQIATITGANLSFSRGLVWLEDAHYNASKGACPPQYSGNPVCQDQHTFTWDNVAFDGPFTYRDFSYDALDFSTTPDANGNLNIAQTALPNQMTSWNVLNVPANPNPAAVKVLFNWRTYFGNVPNNLLVTVNNHAHTVAYPYPANDSAAGGSSFGTTVWRTYALIIPVTDLVASTNVVQIGTDIQNDNTVVSNVNIVLVDVPGGVPVLPGSNNAYPAASQ
jgi:hypothetical protein